MRESCLTPALVLLKKQIDIACTLIFCQFQCYQPEFVFSSGVRVKCDCFEKYKLNV